MVIKNKEKFRCNNTQICYRCITIDDYPNLVFKIGNGETKTDRLWLKKKKEYFEKMWKKNNQKIMKKIEEHCGDTFTNTSKKEGISVIIHKKTPKTQTGNVKEDKPLEINIYLTKNDSTNYMREILIQMLVRSFIHQQYEFHFRIREQTLFEDILADEFVTSMTSFMVMGKKIGKTNCAKALDQAIEVTVYRLSQKTARDKLVNLMYNLYQEYSSKNKNRNTDILENREEFIAKLIEFLPKTVETI